jgi:hypothetical protein
MNAQTGRSNPQGAPTETGNEAVSTTAQTGEALSTPTNVEREPSRYSFEGLLLFRP